jgi:hypothetical protein
MTNVFNFMLCIVMFQELCVVVGDAIILLTMGTPQGGSFGEPLFALANL